MRLWNMGLGLQVDREPVPEHAARTRDPRRPHLLDAPRSSWRRAAVAFDPAFMARYMRAMKIVTVTTGAVSAGDEFALPATGVDLEKL
jgi:hypothetical protein